MIQANELRIGNLINLVSFEGDIMEINIMASDIELCDENESQFNVNYKPIPITEEWLLKSGFNQFYMNGKLTHYRINLYFIKFDGEDYYFQLGKGMIVQVKTIHSLQNLYFALTGEELTLSVT